MKVSTSAGKFVNNTSSKIKKGKALRNVKEGLSHLGKNLSSRTDVIDLSKAASKLVKNDIPVYLAEKIATSKAYDLAGKLADFALGDWSEDDSEVKREDNKTNEDKVSHKSKEVEETKINKEKIHQENLEKLEKKQLAEQKKKEKEEKVEHNVSKFEKHVLTQKIEKNIIKDGSLKKPGIFFLTGTRPLGMIDYGGIEKMAEKIQGARLYGQSQVSDIIKEIDKRSEGQPIILVGHSTGGDSAVEVAQKLNSLDHGFRTVDLLVTLDAFGMDHSIIPPNVAKHLNFFGEKSWFLNDGPHVARDTTRTKVENFLRSEDHDQLDDSPEIQLSIVESIRDALNKVS